MYLTLKDSKAGNVLVPWISLEYTRISVVWEICLGLDKRLGPDSQLLKTLSPIRYAFG